MDSTTIKIMQGIIKHGEEKAGKNWNNEPSQLPILKKYLCSYHWSKPNDVGFGEYTFTTPDKINFEFIEELRIKIKKEFDCIVSIVILNIVCLTDL